MTATLLTEPDVYAAVIAFLKEYALPAVDEANIYRGWQNRSALPANTNDYIIVSVLNGYRRGTNVKRYEYPDGEDGTVALHELVEVGVQIDFCSDDETAMRRAWSVETIARDALGVDFFSAWGIGCLYAGDVREMSFVGDDNNFVRRYVLELQLSYWTGVKVSQEAAASVAFDIENVDAHHRPEESE